MPLTCVCLAPGLCVCSGGYLRAVGHHQAGTAVCQGCRGVLPAVKGKRLLHSRCRTHGSLLVTAAVLNTVHALLALCPLLMALHTLFLAVCVLVAAPALQHAELTCTLHYVILCCRIEWMLRLQPCSWYTAAAQHTSHSCTPTTPSRVSWQCSVLHHPTRSCCTAYGKDRCVVTSCCKYVTEVCGCSYACWAWCRARDARTMLEQYQGCSNWSCFINVSATLELNS
jgi:hypothetical protein